MKFVSTRGQAPVQDFEGALLAGLASDGGLYVPEAWPQFSKDEIRAMGDFPHYQAIARKVMRPFVGDAIPDERFADMIEESYLRFSDQSVTPVQLLDEEYDISLLNLACGPTLAFKDVALQLVGRQFAYALAKSNSHMTILGATSGDTGSAAIEACRGRDRISTFILFPHNRTSEVQRRQMTTVPDENVHAIAVEGTFDDCQGIVKELFGDADLKEKLKLTAVNSINWARIQAQIVYYFYAAIKLGAPEKEVSFCVPSGNFGDAFAGYAAAKMGLPIKKLVVATNSNDILDRFLRSGTMLKHPVLPTHSPSMDIGVSSNFERLLFDYHGRDPEQVKWDMRDLHETGQFSIALHKLRSMRELFASGMANNAQTEKTIAETYRNHRRLIDTHTAVGLSVVRKMMAKGEVFEDEPIICLETAHPAKFPDVVKKATGVHPPLPDHMKDLFERSERMPVLPNSAKAVREYLLANTRS